MHKKIMETKETYNVCFMGREVRSEKEEAKPFVICSATLKQ
jgi:hypothetical protein